jgi:putative glutathione S-transferase
MGSKTGQRRPLSCLPRPRVPRPESGFRNLVTADGSSGFRAESGRYHLYVSLACPWAHRVVLVRAHKRLERAVSMTITEPVCGPLGWELAGEESTDTVNGFATLRDAYRATDPSFEGPAAVPVLWDRRRRLVVNNHPTDILRTLNGEFEAFGDRLVDLYPERHRAEIDALLAIIDGDLTDGVFRAGFATTQADYAEACLAVFAALDRLDERLATRRFLTGDEVTEADWCLFATLVRFDAAYYGRFRCNVRRVVDYPNLWGYVRDLYALPGIAATVRLDHIKRHYWALESGTGPDGVVPLGPALDFEARHDRAALGANR